MRNIARCLLDVVALRLWVLARRLYSLRDLLQDEVVVVSEDTEIIRAS